MHFLLGHRLLTFSFLLSFVLSGCTQRPSSQVTKSRLPPPGFERLPQILILGRPENMNHGWKPDVVKQVLKLPSREWLESTTGFRIEGLDEDPKNWSKETAIEKLRTWNARPFDLWIVFDRELMSTMLFDIDLPLQTGRRILFSKTHFQDVPPNVKLVNLDQALKNKNAKKIETFEFDLRSLSEVFGGLLENQNISEISPPGLRLKLDELYLGPLGFSENISPSKRVHLGISWSSWLEKVVGSRVEILGPETSRVSFYNSTMKMELNANSFKRDPEWDKKFSTWQTQVNLRFLRNLP